MLDLETMDNTTSSAIIEIGACVFSSARGIEDEFSCMVELESSLAAGLTAGAGTILWWLNQSWDARKRMIQTKDKRSLEEALDHFAIWIPDKAIVWGNGSDFDNVILKNAYWALGREHPWPKMNDRCFRTLKNLFKDVKPPEREGTYHAALDDAKHQARWALKIFEERLQKR